MKSENLPSDIEAAQAALKVKLARGRKSGKPFVMLACPEDGRHIRAFIADRTYVENLICQAEDKL